MHHLIESIMQRHPPLGGYNTITVNRRRTSVQKCTGPLTAERLKELLYYDPGTGIFTWLVDRIRVRSGDRAGKLTPEGYIHIGIDGRRYQAHRLAFLYMTGSIPENLIDHENLDPSDNRWRNLREATNSQNQMNTRRKSNNTSGFKGVSWHKSERRWRADVRIHGKKISLGYFASAEAAHEAYKAYAGQHHGVFSRA